MYTIKLVTLSAITSLLFSGAVLAQSKTPVKYTIAPDSKTARVEAGPLSNDADAATKCTKICQGLDLQWSKQWRTTKVNSMAECDCTKSGQLDAGALAKKAAGTTLEKLLAGLTGKSPKAEKAPKDAKSPSSKSQSPKGGSPAAAGDEALNDEEEEEIEEEEEEGEDDFGDYEDEDEDDYGEDDYGDDEE